MIIRVAWPETRLTEEEMMQVDGGQVLRSYASHNRLAPNFTACPIRVSREPHLPPWLMLREEVLYWSKRSGIWASFDI